MEGTWQLTFITETKNSDNFEWKVNLHPERKKWKYGQKYNFTLNMHLDSRNYLFFTFQFEIEFSSNEN